ncbi:hypothetical protein JCM15548_13471 [Geofilum rubicundum JCM 15548]|uniref:Uncharacterized protein n=1 Tax=Geofilum rubicundum JCM 15548 TaxID=1236989 RepID=A0A0E9M0W1_9BACT|nr:hypothetical protein JCM15548_13471 [Geofilum rubicundum JCM 15548]
MALTQEFSGFYCSGVSFQAGEILKRPEVFLDDTDGDWFVINDEAVVGSMVTHLPSLLTNEF